MNLSVVLSDAHLLLSVGWTQHNIVPSMDARIEVWMSVFLVEKRPLVGWCAYGRVLVTKVTLVNRGGASLRFASTFIVGVALVSRLQTAWRAVTEKGAGPCERCPSVFVECGNHSCRQKKHQRE